MISKDPVYDKSKRYEQRKQHARLEQAGRDRYTVIGRSDAHRCIRTLHQLRKNSMHVCPKEIYAYEQQVVD
ncbi:hypothetical protein LENED_008934 [Lentinula edodes]|uniref:Uncharacterized protein n=1 Tax=Lentinula edodes TaxID=5353 RepID=A0A1Q3EIF2_LENED|nr:hypothetical protein LENED_008934 [Lentinula edodes]